MLRCWIDKPDGGQRPLGLPTVEDKIVEGAVVEILNCIYEEDFKGFSYGFRPGRSQHHGLQSLQTVLQKGRVNWALDADISEFFDSIDHKGLMSVIHRRVADRSLLRLIGTRRDGLSSPRVTCLEEPDAVTPHVRICEGEIQ